MRIVRGHGAGGVTPPADRVGILGRLLAGGLCALVSLALALPLGACATQAPPEQADTEATDAAGEAQVTPSDPAGIVSHRVAEEPEAPESADVTGDGTSDEAGGESDEVASDETDGDALASGSLTYTNDFFGFVAELPAKYSEMEPDLVTDEGDTVVLSAGDANGDACLILTHTLPADEKQADGDGKSVETEDSGDADTDEDADDNAGDDTDDANEDDIDAVGDEESADDADDAVETVFDPIDDWARTYAAWVIAELEDEGATITRSEIGRGTLGGASCVIVEIEFDPRGGASEGEAGGAQRDLFFFDGGSDASSVGLCVDCLALTKEALDALENTFVAI